MMSISLVIFSSAEGIFDMSPGQNAIGQNATGQNATGQNSTGPNATGQMPPTVEFVFIFF